MFTRKGQSTLEYAIIIAVVIAGLIVMQHYVKRGYQGRLKQGADEMGEQFDPNAYSATFEHVSAGKMTQEVKDKATTTTYTTNQVSFKNATGEGETLEKWNKERDMFSQ